MIIIEDLNDKSPMATNISLETLYKAYSQYKKSDNLTLKGFPQKDDASLNAKKNLPEICFSRSEFLPQKNGIVPTENLRVGQLIKIVLNIDNVLNLRGVKKPYPVSYGNANKEKALDTETRGEERIQVSEIPMDKKYMTIYIPDDLFKSVFENIGPIQIDKNSNIKKFMEGKDDFKNWIDEKKKEGLIKTYKDTSRKAYKRNVINKKVFNY